MLKRPAVTPFVECPNCQRLIEYGVERCPACHEEISGDYARLSAAVVIHNTQACSLANTIKSGEYAAIISGLAAVYAYAFGRHGYFLIAVATPVVFLLAVGLWFRRFGKFRIGDEDYQKARRDMRASLKLWLALLFAQVVAFVYTLRTS